MEIYKVKDNKLEKMRIWKNLTQADVANVLGVDLNEYRNIEKGGKVDKKKVNKLSNFFNVSIFQMFYKSTKGDLW